MDAYNGKANLLRNAVNRICLSEKGVIPMCFWDIVDNNCYNPKETKGVKLIKKLKNKNWKKFKKILGKVWKIQKEDEKNSKRKALKGKL